MHKNIMIFLQNLAKKFYFIQVINFNIDDALAAVEFKSERLYTIKYLLMAIKVLLMTQLGLTLKQLKPSDYLNGARKKSE